ncbi:MAG: hypothetical protein WC464_05110 [Bdellovibrionales bacterium]
MDQRKTLFMLGAEDPEMDRIVEVLESEGQDFEFATKNGKRVAPSNAYAADPPGLSDDHDLIVYVECRPEHEPLGIEKKVIDHHREGDPGYNMEAKRYWEASSLGQLHNFLKLTPTKRDFVLAAMDHCFAAALRGECPNVTKDEVLELKINEISRGSDFTPEQIRQKVLQFREELKSSPMIGVGGTLVRDMRHVYLGEGYTVDYLSAQAAVALSGDAALLHGSDPASGFRKITIYGNVNPKTIEAFMKEWAPAQGLSNIYGVPDRCYGGGYLHAEAAPE